MLYIQHNSILTVVLYVGIIELRGIFVVRVVSKIKIIPHHGMTNVDTWAVYNIIYSDSQFYYAILDCIDAKDIEFFRYNIDMAVSLHYEYLGIDAEKEINFDNVNYREIWRKLGGDKI